MLMVYLCISYHHSHGFWQINQEQEKATLVNMRHATLQLTF